MLTSEHRLSAAGEKIETTATASLRVDRCIGYFSIAVTKHLEQGSSGNKLLMWVQGSRAESGMKLCCQKPESEGSHLALQAQFKFSKPTPSDIHSPKGPHPPNPPATKYLNASHSGKHVIQVATTG